MDSKEFSFSFPLTLLDRIRLAFLLAPQSKTVLAAWAIWPLIDLCYFVYFVAEHAPLDADFWWFVVFCLAFTPWLRLLRSSSHMRRNGLARLARLAAEAA